MTFEKDTRPIIASALWSWILIWIPTLIIWMRVKNTATRLEGGVITHTTGAVTKSTTNIDLYRVKSVSSQDSFFTGGSLSFTYSDGSTETLRYIRNATELSPRFRTLIDEQRKAQNIRSHDKI